MQNKFISISKDQAIEKGLKFDLDKILCVENKKGIMSIKDFLKNGERTFFTFDPKSFDNVVLETMTGHIILGLSDEADSIYFEPETAKLLGEKLISFANKAIDCENNLTQ